MMKDTESRVNGFRAGGVDYLLKPIEIEELLIRVETHLKLNRLMKALSQKNAALTSANEQLRQEIARRKQAEIARDQADAVLQTTLSLISQDEAERWGIAGCIGRSQAMAEVIKNIRQLQKAVNLKVLITGETGTGKGMIARAIHFGGPRAKGPFEPINCAAIPDELAESELFGHVKGAFTGATESRKGKFELANGGTIFLDEIGDLSPRIQAKILRVLQEGEVELVGGSRRIKVDVRVIAATNKELDAEMKARNFRADLYYRLAEFQITVPPLRERKEDIPLLANHFLKTFGAEMGREATLTPEVLSVLEAYPFPGNVRQLQDIIKSALIKSEGSALIQPEHLPGLVGKPTDIPCTPQTDEERILAYVKAHGSINNKECRRLLTVDIHRASNLLRKLTKDGALIREGRHRHAKYRLP
ncbi:sigma-54-dependent Fis family transcriptional regulator [Candidatus Poribacteria bacterium]|nr:sigma-54-dependent Fis family transcriptional regulator [Candidatus Poribacteria bacterium]